MNVAEKHSNDRVFRRLNSISSPDDSISNETKYHFRYWVDMKRVMKQKDGSCSTQEIHDTHYAAADIEIINFVKEELKDPSRNILTKKYRRENVQRDFCR